MPYRRIEGSASDYEYTESDEETGTGIVPNASYGEDSEDKWDVDVQTLCQKRCLFTVSFIQRASLTQDTS